MPEYLYGLLLPRGRVRSPLLEGGSTDARRFSKSEVHLQDRKFLHRVLNLSMCFSFFCSSVLMIFLF